MQVTSYKSICPKMTTKAGLLCLYSLSGWTSYRKISWVSGLDFFNRSEIWQAPRQQHRRDACQIAERYDNYNIQSRGFETSRYLVLRRLGEAQSTLQGSSTVALCTRVEPLFVICWLSYSNGPLSRIQSWQFACNNSIAKVSIMNTNTVYMQLW